MKPIDKKKQSLKKTVAESESLSLASGLRKMRAGQDPSLAEQLAIERARVGRKKRARAGQAIPGVAAREAEMLKMRQAGKTYAEIGEAFGIKRSAAHEAVQQAVVAAYSRPAEEYLAALLEGLNVEITESRNMLSRLRSATESVDPAWLASRNGLAVVREITSASSVLERCLATAARISGAEAPKKIEVALETKKVLAFQDQIATALTMALSRVIGRYHDVETTARIGHEILAELEALQPKPEPAPEQETVDAVAEIVEQEAAGELRAPDENGSLES